MSQLQDSRQRVNSPLTFLFSSGLQHIGWDSLILGRANSFTQSLVSSRNTFTDTPKIIFNQISWHLMAYSLTHAINLPWAQMYSKLWPFFFFFISPLEKPEFVWILESSELASLDSLKIATWSALALSWIALSTTLFIFVEYNL